MSAPFLATTVPGMRIAVEVAWGADLTDLTAASWTWSDITADVVLGGQGHSASSGVSITIGRPDFSQETQTAVMTCQLDNRDSAYSEGGMSSNWPNVRRGTPVRVRVSNDAGATWSLRFQGQANGFTPQWDAETGRWATVELSASGPLRRLNQGMLPSFSVYRTEIPRDTTGWPGLLAYWPCEGGNGANGHYAAVPVSGFPRLQVPSALRPGIAAVGASVGPFPYSGPLGDGFSFTAGLASGLTGDAPTPNSDPFPAYTNTGTLQFRMMLSGKYPMGGGALLLAFRTSNVSPVRTWTLSLDSNGNLNLQGYSGDGYVSSVVEDSNWITFGIDTPVLISLTMTNSGSNLNFRVALADQQGTTDSYAASFTGVNIGSLNSSNGGVWFNGPNIGATNAENITVGHCSVHTSASTSLASALPVFSGLPGETTMERLSRLCQNGQIPLTVLDSTVAQSGTSITDTVGAQFYDNLTTLLRETELTGQGLLYDGLGTGLTYVTKRRRTANANGPAALTIDANADQMMEPFVPIDDDQVTINHCDVTRRNGTTVSYMDRTGPMGTDAIGDYATSYTANPEGDAGLLHYAEWAVGIGTQPGYRYPTVSFALEVNPELVAGWLACTPQSRIDVTNVATIRRQHPDETIKLLLEGWQETIDAFTWRVTANTSSAVPWNVAKLAAATGSTGDGICHMDTDGSQLNANAASGATSISVKTITGPLWVTSAADADSFPFDLDVGGIKATVTAITSATSPQTFTLSAPLPRAFTGSTTNGAGTPVKVWRPPVFGL